MLWHEGQALLYVSRWGALGWAWESSAGRVCLQGGPPEPV